MGYCVALSFRVVLCCCCLFTVPLSLVDCARTVSAKLQLPPIVTTRLTPLTTLQKATYLDYIKQGSISQHIDDFCKEGHLFCGGSIDEHAAKWLSNQEDDIFANIKDDDSFVQWDDICPLCADDVQRGLQHETVETLTYFRESNLAVGGQIVVPKFLYGDEKPTTAFLPEMLANQFPLLAPQFPELLQTFKIAPDTQIASQMATIVDYCSRLDKKPKTHDAIVIGSCTTSLKAMLRFASSLMQGRPMQAITNSKMVGMPGKPVKLLEKVEKQGVGGALVDCHDMVFPFLMYGCHSVKQSKAFQVTLQAEDGNTMQLLVACHKNTSTFNPADHAFALLNSSPGKTEICHWLPSKDILWLPA